MSLSMNVKDFALRSIVCRFGATSNEAGFSARGPLAIALGAGLAWWIWMVPTGLSAEARLVMIAFGLCVIGWTMTTIGDTLIALAAALGLVAIGAVSPEEFYRTLGTELIWLLVASFVIAAVLKASGVSDRLVMMALANVTSIRALFLVLTLVISATALVIPSTSGRAALLLPAFLAIAARLDDGATIKALALLFPTVILLSAGGTLIGAGAHLLAVDYIRRLGGPELDYLSWLLLAMPFALATSIAAMEIILRVFLDPMKRSASVSLATDRPRDAWSREHIWLIGVVSLTVALWVLTPLHGFGAGVVAIGGALAATAPGLSPVSLKNAFKVVEWDMLIFMAATLLLGDALLATNADEWMARRLLILLGGGGADYGWLIAVLVALVALTAHLVITSRTARATVLIPAVAIPLTALGFQPAALIFLTVMGTGFCQTLMASAKPVALFGTAEGSTYGQADLLRLSLWLFPMMLVALMVFATVIWPMMGLGLTR
jgi:solute carrier family 13 (sodium-dependent dicarboxylate transporter), member 2/3/5